MASATPAPTSPTPNNPAPNNLTPSSPTPRGGASALRAIAALAPGLALCGALTAVAYVLAQVPRLDVLGALGIALLLGIAWRATAGLPRRAAAGSTFAARTLLKIGIVLLGVRLDFGLLWQAGARVLLLDVAIIVAGLLFIDWMGRRLKLERGLRLSLAVGSSICGASAIAAAAPVIGADDDDVSVSVGVVSLLGTVGVVAYTVLAPTLQLTAQRYGLMTGSTLHEVAQVLAAGAAQGATALDVATITKLTRVALLAPVLLVVGGLLARAEPKRSHEVAQAKRPPLLPLFLVGFLAVGIVHSLGLIPSALAGVMQSASLLLTASAMVGIGLAVDLRVVRRLGGPAITVAVLGFGLSLVIASIGTLGLSQ